MEFINEFGTLKQKNKGVGGNMQINACKTIHNS